ncbi:MAG: hypothetical protein H8K07_20070 [Nitrospira sp.]|nr:hypothetical protein [Nitrospira sp.]MDI3463546.1 hypothetical protein [Nitrospira sp.]
MDSLWPWVKCRVGVATITLVLGSAGIVFSTAIDRSYAGDTALPPGIVAADVEYNGRIAVNGDPVTVKIATPDKNGVMVFDGTAGQRINIGFSGVTLTQFYVSVYRPDGETVPRHVSAVRNYYATMGERPVSSLTKVHTSMPAYEFSTDSAATISSSEMNGASVDLEELPVTGTYTIFIDPLSTYTGSFKITVSSELSGNIVPHGSAVTANINRTGQKARYTFSGESGQTVSLQLSDVTIRSGYVSIVAPDGSLLGKPISFVSGGGVGGAMIPGQVLPASGTYAVLIESDLSYTGRLKLALYNAPELTGTIMIDQGTVTPTLTVPGQRARYTFNGTEGQRVNLGLTGVSISMSTVSILKPDGSKWESTTVGPSGGSLDPLTTLPATGTYTIAVEPVSNYTGIMTIALSSPLTGTIAIDGASVPVNLTRVGQTARYTFNGKEGQWVNLGLTGVSITSSAVTLLTSDGTILASTAVGTAGGGLEDRNPLPTTGTYTILVDPVGSYTGKMTLTLSTEVSDSLKMNTAPRPITLSRAGQNGRYTFTGMANQQAMIKVTNNKLGSVTVNLYSPNGILLAGMTGSESSFTLNPVTLASADTYTVTINPALTETGSIQLQVSSQ